MHREILTLGRFSLHSWGLMVALGFVFGIILAVHRARKAKYSTDNVYDLTIVLILSSIIGSRLWYVATHISEFSQNWIDVINPFQGNTFGISGMSMVGGVVAAIIAAAVFCLIRKVNIFEIGDIAAPAFLFGMFFGRFGCFLNGCCFGNPSDVCWSAIFPENSPAGNIFPHVHIHPTQIYESLIDLLLFFLLLALEKRYKNFRGWSFWMTFVFYGIGRAIVDFWRWYEPQEILFTYWGGNLSVHGAIALVLAAFSAIMIFLKVGRDKHR